MTQRPEGAPHLFDFNRHADPADTEHQPARARRLSLPLQMDDGTIKDFDLPSALAEPSQFSAAERERLARAYAEALALLNSST